MMMKRINVGDVVLIKKGMLMIERRNADDHDHWAFECDLGRELPCLIVEVKRLAIDRAFVTSGYVDFVRLFVLLPDGRTARTLGSISGCEIYVLPDGTVGTSLRVL